MREEYVTRDLHPCERTILSETLSVNVKENAGAEWGAWETFCKSLHRDGFLRGRTGKWFVTEAGRAALVRTDVEIFHRNDGDSRRRRRARIPKKEHRVFEDPVWSAASGAGFFG